MADAQHPTVRARVGGRAHGLVALALLAASCGEDPAPGIMVHLRAADLQFRPDYVLLTWVAGDQVILKDERYPAAGVIPGTSEDLGKVFFAIDTANGAERTLLGTGYSPERAIVTGAVTIIPSSARREATLMLGRTETGGVPPDAGVADAGVPDGRVPDGPPVAPDAGAPDLRVADGPAPDTLPPDAAPDVPVDRPAPGNDAGAAVNLKEGLIAHWKFEETEGTSVTDSSGNGNTGTMKAGGTLPSSTPSGRVGRALVFFRGGGVVTAKSSATLESIAVTNSFTIAAWTFHHSMQTGPIGIVTRQFGVSPDEHYGVFLHENKLRLAVTSFRSGVSHCDAATAVPLRQWVHVAGTFDGTNARLYVDGVEACAFQRPGSIETTQNALTIGGSYNMLHPYPTEIYDGVLDEVAMWKRDLSPAELRALILGTAAP